MRPIPMLLAAAAAMSLAATASAQGAATPTSASGPVDYSAPLGTPAHPIPQNSPTPADQAYRLKPGDPNVVSNGPVPDTPQNRAAYGQPMSRTGKSTAASGD